MVEIQTETNKTDNGQVCIMHDLAFIYVDQGLKGPLLLTIVFLCMAGGEA